MTGRAMTHRPIRRLVLDDLTFRLLVVYAACAVSCGMTIGLRLVRLLF